jgi:hypothetical protein
MPPTYTRFCCGILMYLRKRLPDGSEEVACRRCGKVELISTSGYATPSLIALVERQADSDAADQADTIASLRADVQQI